MIGESNHLASFVRVLVLSMILLVGLILPFSGQARLDSVPGEATQENTRRPVESRPRTAPVLSERRAASDAVSASVTPLGDIRSEQIQSLQISDPGLTASAAFAVDLTNDMLLYESNADRPVPPASTTKIVTALVTIEHVGQDAIVDIETSDLVDTTVYSNMALQNGDRVTVRDLLAGLLLPSGGDAARALSRYVGEQLVTTPGEDPRSAFIDAMNDKADEIGMKNSRFLNATGNDQDGHVSTARDLAIAANALFQDQFLQELVSLTSYSATVTGPNARQIELTNTNLLLPVENVHGVKTGTTGAGGECLVLATKRGEARVLVVILGSSDRYSDVQRLLDHLDQQITWVEFGAPSTSPRFGEQMEEYGFEVMVRPTIPIPAEDADRIRYRLTLGVRPDGDRPRPWGYVVFLIDGEPFIGLHIHSSSNGS